MRTLKPLLPALLLALNLTTAAAQPADEPTPAQIDALFAEWDHPDTPGGALAVLQGGEVVYRRGYGMADLDYDRPITPATVFDIASVSKQFGAFAIALLVDQGKIALDDDVRRYVPDVPDFGPTITIRHLVHHTSGLRDWPGTLALAGWSMEDVISFAQILRMVRHQQALNFTPGDEYLYSNTGYNVLARVVEKVTGQSFRAWTDAHIFAPLGMVHTHFHDDHEEVVENRAESYARTGDTFKRLANDLTALGSSSLYTTIDDLARWVQHFRRPRLGGAKVMDLMHRQGVLNNGDTISYAFGNSIGTYRGVKTVAHSGSWAGFRTYLVRFPDQDFAVIVLGNVNTANPTRKAEQVAELYLGDRMTPETAPTSPETWPEPVAVDPALLDDYAGTYQLGPGWLVTITRYGDGLMTQATQEPAFPMTPTSDTRFYVEAYGAAITFQRDDEGRVTHFEYKGMHAPRVELFTPGAAELKAFVGDYYSMELETTYTIALANGRLTATHPRHGTSTLTPTLTDTFGADAWWFMGSIHFMRDGAGRVTGFEASSGRVRHVRFEKVR